MDSALPKTSKALKILKFNNCNSLPNSRLKRCLERLRRTRKLLRSVGCGLFIYNEGFIAISEECRDTSILLKYIFTTMSLEGCGEEGQVKLLGASISPFVFRVRIALALKGIHYHFVEENLQKKSQLLLQSNPIHKKIPVLIHNGKPVCESMIIVQYIEEAWGNKAPNLMPKDPYDRAIARFWAAFVDDKVVPCLRGVFTGQGEQQQKAVQESVVNFLVLEEALRTSPCFSGKLYFGGDEIGFVDVALGGLSGFVKALQKATNSVLIDEEKMPLLSAWMDRFCEADGVKESMPDPAKVLKFISAMRVKFTSPPTAK